MRLRRYLSFEGMALLTLMQGALLTTSCSSSEGERASGLADGDLGQVQLNLSVGNAIELASIEFKVLGNGFEQNGSADVERSNKARLEIGGIPAGKNYTVSLTAKDIQDPKTTCQGSGEFDIEAGKQSKTTVNLQCRKPRKNGSVVVNGELNVCPLIDELSVLPFETNVGGTVKLVARATDLDKAPSTLSYLWGANGGKLAQAESPKATFQCTEIGTFTVSLTVDDGDCTDAVTATVICTDPRDTGPNPECPEDLLVAYSATPLQSSTLGTVDVAAKLFENNGNLPPVKWSATGGSFTDPSAAKTQYLCKDAGEQTLTLSVGAGACVEKASFNVTCTQLSCADQSMEPGEPCKNPLPIVHTFAPNMSHLISTRELPPDPPTTRTRPKGLNASNVRAVSLPIPSHGDAEFLVTPEVSDKVFAYLASQLKPIPFDPQLHKPLLAFLNDKPELQRGEAEVQLPLLIAKNGDPVLFNLPDGWQWVRPWVIRWRPSPNAGNPSDSTGDVGVSTQALTGSWTTVQGVLQCRAPGADALPLSFAEVTVAGQTTRTDASGAFSVSASFSEVDTVEVRYHGDVETAGTPGGTVVSPLTVMNDFHNPRSEHFDVLRGTTTDSVLDVGTLISASLDCELFALGAEALTEYHGLVGSSPPSGNFRIKRWEGVDVGTPYAFYDYVVIARNFRGFADTPEERRATIFHEFGHTVRHVADGDSGHWNWDNFRWVYARAHSGVEVFNEHYAFNEGWAQYWECTRSLPPASCPQMPDGVPTRSFLDWNELRIGERLLGMSSQPGFNHAAMVNILTSNRGSIHTFREFEVRYCAAATSFNAFCSGGVPRRVKRSCPPGFVDDGATCRQPNILAKDSYGRGAGTIPTGCGSAESDAGLCYNPCPAGFDGVGPVCWERCPSGYHDDGAFCRRDAHIITSNNSACDFWDKCGLTFDAGCSICPAGFHNDGCFCRRDAHIFAKQTRGRGVGTIPRQCSAGKVYDAGLCYDRCLPNFTGVGPVCWGRCPSGFDDHGATCYREPNILVKF